MSTRIDCRAPDARRRHREYAPRRVATATLLALAATAAAADESVTFSEHVAPLVHAHCAPCHRPGESAPFDLLDYEDVRGHAKDIVKVTRTRFMPPWLPEPGFVEYLGERLLAPEELELLSRWVEQGAPHGDPALTPPLPTWTDGWQLGEPDLVVTMAEVFTLPAETRQDVFRNFVIPVPVTSTRHVKAVEFRPGHKRVVHHAVMRVDRTRTSRRRDEREPGPGFSGMDFGVAYDPDGYSLGWTPGRLPLPGDDDRSWRLEPGMDLVLQLHMQPTGKEEQVRPSVGFYFTDRPPRRLRWSILLELAEIDIPPGEQAWVGEDRFELPVDLEVVSVYPHAHYVGRDMQGWATLPDGTRKWLVRITDWNFDWQDEYQLREPMLLPAGTTVHMRYTYDNSEDNVRNPHYPPQRIRAGNRSTDEMGNLYLGVVPRNAEDLEVLKESLLRQAIAKRPDDWVVQYNLGVLLESRRDVDQAEAQFRRTIELNPEFPDVYSHMGNIAMLRGQVGTAIPLYREAIRLNPDNAQAYYNLGHALQETGQLDEAAVRFRQALQITPGDADAHNNLANILMAQGLPEQAIEHYRQALASDPGLAAAQANLGSALLQAGHVGRAVEHYRAALALAPDSEDTKYNLEVALGLLSEIEGEIAQAERAVAAGGSSSPRQRLELAEMYAAAGRYRRALEEMETVLRQAVSVGDDGAAQQLRQRMEQYRRMQTDPAPG